MFEPGTNILTEQAREANRLRHELGLTQEAQWIAIRERDEARIERDRYRAALYIAGDEMGAAVSGLPGGFHVGNWLDAAEYAAAKEMLDGDTK